MSAHEWRKAQESLVSLERNNVASVDSIVRYDFHRDKSVSDLFRVTYRFNLSTEEAWMPMRTYALSSPPLYHLLSMSLMLQMAASLLALIVSRA